MPTVYLGLGSNLGDRVGWLRQAQRLLDVAGGGGRGSTAADEAIPLRVVAVSSYWLTEPVGDARLPWFVNCAVAVETEASAQEVMGRAMRIESELGRVRQGPLPQSRTLDIDVLLYDSLVIDDSNLQVPHPRMLARRFVLEPLAEIAGDVVHPVNGLTIGELAARVVSSERAWVMAPADRR